MIDHWDAPDDDEYPEEDVDASTGPCPNCGEEMIDDAEQCPHCGEYIVYNTGAWSGRPAWWIALGLLGILAVISVIALVF